MYRLLSTILFLFCCLHQQAQPAAVLNAGEKIFYNGKIFTADREHPFAEALAVRGDRILAVGNLRTLKKLTGKKAVLIDLEGKILLPGFADSHTHAVKGGISLGVPNVFEELLTPDSLYRFVLKASKDTSLYSGDVLLVYGVNITTWSSLDQLDALFNRGELEKIPVLLRGSDGHTAWANKTMLLKAGITASYLLSITGDSKKHFGTKEKEPNGFVSESGLVKLFRAIQYDEEYYQRAVLKAVRYNNSYGITAWLDPSAASLDNPEEAPFLDAYRWLADRHGLTAHVAATVVADADKDPAAQIKQLHELQKKYNGTGLYIKGFKIFADGVIEYPTQTAALSLPYKNTGEKGELLFRPQNFARFVTMADKAGLLVHIHAIGDYAVSASLDGIEAARKKNGYSGLPHTLTHAQIVLPPDFHRFHDLHVPASLQLLWAFADATTIDIVKPYIDSSLFRWQYPAASLLKTGALICGASDWPVSSGNPFEAIARAETRKGPLGVLDPAQSVPRMDMLYAYTINAATAMMMEKETGSLEKGKRADMIIVDRDIFTVSAEELANAKVLCTFFGGKIVYKAN